MSVNKEAFYNLKSKMDVSKALLVAVSKTKPNEDIETLYALGHRDFGENYVQELIKKNQELPSDIHWHFIGHLQSNKIKQIAPFVHLIHGVDSLKLLEVIDKEGKKLGKKINCLVQVHISKEETKFGFDVIETRQVLTHYFIENKYSYVNLCGLMGMASFTEDKKLVHQEFSGLKSLFDEIKEMKGADTSLFNTLSMGMSGDYGLALENGSTLIRVGSLLFGSRN